MPGTAAAARLSQADKYGVPRICFVNKMDRLGANFYRCRDMVIRCEGAMVWERLCRCLEDAPALPELLRASPAVCVTSRVTRHTLVLDHQSRPTWPSTPRPRGEGGSA